MVTRQLVTAEELVQMPDSGQRYELMDGELIAVSPAFTDHSWTVQEIARLIGNFVVEHSLGEVFGADAGFRLSQSPDTVLSPDVSFVSNRRLPPSQDWHGYLPIAPDLALEVLSPSNTAKEMAEKSLRYFAAGAVLVVIVNPRLKTVDIQSLEGPSRRHSNGDTLDLGEVLPGLQIPLPAIFRRLS